MTRFGAVFSHFGHMGLLGVSLAVGLAALGVFLRLGLGRRRSGAKAKEARRQWARRLADASFDGLLLHRNGTVLQMNRALVRMLGYREAELLGTPFANLAGAAQMAALRTELEAPQPQIAVFTLQHADKSEINVEMASHTLEVDGRPATVTAIRDVTALRAAEARLAYLKQNDALTGLANAAMFAEKLQDAVARNDAAGGTTAVLLLELGTLQAVNALLGRKGGEILRRQAASRLRALAHESDIVARLGGNQFAIVQPHAGAANRTAILTSQIEAAMEEPFIVEGMGVKASMAIGVAVYPEHATSAEGLADAGLFALGKAIERGGVANFSFAEAAQAGFRQPGMPLASPMPSLEAQRLAYDLRQAIPRGELSLEYQPVFSGRYLSVAGYAAQARWWHPKQGEIPPDRLLALADQAGLSSLLGNFILEAACAEAMRNKVPMMAVTLSAGHLREPRLLSHIRDILHKTGLPPNRLELQVSEAMLLDDPSGAPRVLRALQAMGLVLSLVEFGPGLAALGDLSRFSFNRMKIGAKTIHLLGQDNNALAMIGALLTLARGLQIEVIADGVETEAQLRLLQEKDCSFVQGDYLGPAGPDAANRLATPAPAKPSLVVTQR